MLNHLLRIAPAALRERVVLSRVRYDEASLRDVRVTLAENPRDVAMAARLVHDAYVGRGLMDPHPSGLKFHPQAVLPTTLTFVAKRDDRLVGTLSFVVDSPLGLPMEDTHGPELAALRRLGERMGEVSALAVEPSARHSGVLFLLIRAVLQSALALGIERAVMAVAPRAQDLFTATLLCEPLGTAREYAGLRAPSVALTLALRDVRRRFEARFARYGNTAANSARLYFGMDCPSIAQPPVTSLWPTAQRTAAHAALARLRMDVFRALPDDKLAFLREELPSVLWPSRSRLDWSAEAAASLNVVLHGALPSLEGASV